MAMSLNIKSDEAYRLARQLAQLTGESMTSAVIRALAERLERVGRERGGGLANRLLAIGRDCAAHLKEPYRSVDHANCSTMIVFRGDDFTHTDMTPTLERR